MGLHFSPQIAGGGAAGGALLVDVVGDVPVEDRGGGDVADHAAHGGGGEPGLGALADADSLVREIYRFFPVECVGPALRGFARGRGVASTVLHSFLAVAFQAQRVEGLDAIGSAQGFGGFTDYARRGGLGGRVGEYREDERDCFSHGFQNISAVIRWSYL